MQFQTRPLKSAKQAPRTLAKHHASANDEGVRRREPLTPRREARHEVQAEAQGDRQESQDTPDSSFELLRVDGPHVVLVRRSFQYYFEAKKADEWMVMCMGLGICFFFSKIHRIM